ncbi:YoaK family protein [Paracidobacterium acidisoli]|uniref:DUF1275 domain-containing protein n=1 Tax=Paracidobacterium acidisoli TaxID=2303751 RepID=A0A372IMT6_9BACT|nr:YoaK family protein [Paracidobacterium acidisoli]MBT9331675.1 DUF1275 domain-containing protein [Paracidobacterium acidisoli]
MTTLVPAARHRTMPHVFLLVALLCSIAGAVDTLGYIRLGGVFVANLTGNTVLLAWHAEQRQWADAALRMGLILTYFAGVVTDHLMRRWIRADRLRINPAVASLMIEFFILCTLAFLGVEGNLRVTLLLILAWTMGLQNDAFQQIGPVNLNTTFLTGNIEKLGSILTTPVEGVKKERERRLQIGALIIAWTAYGTGAVVGAIGSHLFALRALLLPAALVIPVLLLEIFGPRQRTGA